MVRRRDRQATPQERAAVRRNQPRATRARTSRRNVRYLGNNPAVSSASNSRFLRHLGLLPRQAPSYYDFDWYQQQYGTPEQIARQNALGRITEAQARIRRAHMLRGLRPRSMLRNLPGLASRMRAERAEAINENPNLTGVPGAGTEIGDLIASYL